MRVILIAHTQVHVGGLSDLSAAIDYSHGSGSGTDADRLAEISGRNCYQSWSNPSGRRIREYLDNIIKQGHFSVLEHASATFYIDGVSRSLLTELTRHRHLSFSVMSQRYVDEGFAEMVYPPDIDEDDHDMIAEMATVAVVAKEAYSRVVSGLTERGWPRKKARSAARAVLPNMTETRMIVTGNHRAWREVIAKRQSLHADAEIRRLAGELLRELRMVAPATYQDFS